MVLGFPAVLLLAGDHKDLLAGAGLAKPGDIWDGDVALAVGRSKSKSRAAARSTRSPCQSKIPGGNSRLTRRLPNWTLPMRLACRATRRPHNWLCRRARTSKACRRLG